MLLTSSFPHDHNLFLHFNLPYILVYCSFPISKNSEIISISTFEYIKYHSIHLYYSCVLYILVYVKPINFIAMNNFDLKKYFGNLIGLPTTAPKKGVSPIKISK